LRGLGLEAGHDTEQRQAVQASLDIGFAGALIALATCSTDDSAGPLAAIWLVSGQGTTAVPASPSDSEWIPWRKSAPPQVPLRPRARKDADAANGLFDALCGGQLRGFLAAGSSV